MKTYHRLLERQIEKARLAELLEDPRVQQLLEQVDNSYYSSDDDRKILEHAMDLSSHELLESNRQLQKLVVSSRAATQAKSDFLANMSHEIRTPLNGILGLIDMLRESKVRADQEEVVSLMNESARSLLSVINEILDISKIESGRMAITPVPTDIKTLLQGMIKLFSAAFRDKDLTVLFELLSDIPPLVLLDEFRVRQIITNLVSNAVKFTPIGGGIVIFMYAEDVQVDRFNLRIAISDTGIGIAPDKLDIIFDKFSQGDNSITRQYGGTGLGLSICQSLINLMKGRLWVRSIEGVGSIFHVEIPTKIVSNLGTCSLNAAPNSKLSVPAGLRVLLAEDNAVNRKVAIHILEKLGCSVAFATNGREVVEKYKPEEVDLIVMDCQMPELSGFEATQVIRAQVGPGATVPIIALTALAMEGDRERCLKSGMNDYVTKPIDRKKFAETIARWAQSVTNK